MNFICVLVLSCLWVWWCLLFIHTSMIFLCIHFHDITYVVLLLCLFILFYILYSILYLLYPLWDVNPNYNNFSTHSVITRQQWTQILSERFDLSFSGLKFYYDVLRAIFRHFICFDFPTNSGCRPTALYGWWIVMNSPLFCFYIACSEINHWPLVAFLSLNALILCFWPEAGFKELYASEALTSPW